MNDELAIEASGLAKSYGGVRVLGGVGLRVTRGSVFALLGPNGAGKTTTVRILATLVRADAGQARVAGFDVGRDRREVRRRISLTGQFAALDATQTGEENLRMIARLAGLPRAAARRRAAELLEQFDLTQAGRRRVGTYSGGMRRRLDLAASLAGHPSVLECAVVGVPSELSEEEVKAFIVAAPGRTPDFAELRAHAAARLAAFKVPRRWVFVDAFPLTGSGKIQKYILRERYVNGELPPA